ncbi:MAG: GspH/FimT family pseudopilin [Rubrivivax sp.]
MRLSRPVAPTPCLPSLPAGAPSAPITTASATRQRGVTLIECCAVIAVLAVLAGTAAPAFVDHLDHRRLEGRASELGADLQHLRSLAVSTNEGMRISFGADAHGSCYVIHRDTDGPCPCTSAGAVACDTAQGDVLKTVVLPATSGLQVSANVASIRIDPKMGTSTPGGTVRLRSASGRELRHVVNIMGRVRTCSPAPGVPGHRRC